MAESFELSALEARVFLHGDLAGGLVIGSLPFKPSARHAWHLHHLRHVAHVRHVHHVRFLARHGQGVVGATPSPLSAVPVLNSLPGATASLYLDFDGAAAQSWGGYTTTATPAYDQDGDVTTFSEDELANIRKIWARVAEGYSPFKLNVTTVDPGNLSDGRTVKVVVGGAGGWLNAVAGGVAYVGAFANGAPNVAWVFTANLGNGAPKYAADAALHESGHTFGLNHQSQYSGMTKTAEYRSGTAQVSPIMGVSYFAERGLWSDGQSSLSSYAYQDDMAAIASVANGFGYRADDHGDTGATASPLTAVAGSVSAAGVIGRTNDVDAFTFVTGAGAIGLAVDVAAQGPTLDATLKLFDSAGALVATADTASLGESLSAVVPAGAYRLVVSSKGSYGDVGQYTVRGQIVPPPADAATPAPANLSVALSIATQANLSWTNVTGESGYRVEQSVDGGAWATLTTRPANVTTHTAVALVLPGALYAFRVVALGPGGESEPSPVASVRTPLAAVTGLSAIGTSAAEVDLAWADAAGESGYVVERSANGMTFSGVGNVPADAHAFADVGLAAGTTYYYRVRAVNGGGLSPASARVIAMTRPAATTLTAAALSTSQLRLAWVNVTGETGYRVERAADGVGGWVTRGTTLANATTFLDAGLSPDGRYLYRVTPFNGSGDAASATAEGRTLAAAPLGLTAQRASATSITLTWKDSSGETAYKLERLIGTQWTPVATPAANATTFIDPGLTPNRLYLYRLRATTAAGDSAPGSTASAVTAAA